LSSFNPSTFSPLSSFSRHSQSFSFSASAVSAGPRRCGPTPAKPIRTTPNCFVRHHSDGRSKMDTRLTDNTRFKGVRTPGCHAKSVGVMYLLHAALATEMVCVLRHKQHYFTATGISPESVEQSLRNSIRDELIAQRIAIDCCREMIRHTDGDPASRRMLEGILASEEEHAEDLSSLLKEFCPDPIPASSTDQALSCPTGSSHQSKPPLLTATSS